MVALKALFVLATCTLVSGSAIPIWELLTKQEKMGRLMYVFIHLVDQYCKDSNIPDCQKVLTLYGMSNLVNEEENSLDFMDPYQRDSRSIIWEKVMKGDFKLPSGKTFYSNDPSSADDEDYELVNEVRDSSYPSLSFRKNTNDPHPYAVRVPAPVKVAAAHARAQTQTDAQVGGVPSSHPYAVRVARETATLGIKASADFEPMRSERRLNPVLIQRILPRSFAASFNSRRNSS
ncbi:uncharacterized protein LOC134773130 [Penaeus indicus]|uniref:uncharacterized protein LOC134773130 n=1 Tax=Penaeus indicus TaxID=29960 RepID=UPI00300D2B35